MVTPTVISLFAGCGGSSLGYKLAGFKELLAVEWDDNAVETFKHNFPTVPVYHGDIKALTGEECMRLAGITVGELDVLDGSPPCQGFSIAGKRRFNDPRNALFMDYARLLSELKPKVFVFENVDGLVKGVMKQAFLVILKTLRECGYRVRGEVMNSKYYGVAQARRRIVLIGVREDLGIDPTFPAPSGRILTAAEAIKDLVNDPEEVAMLLEAGNARRAFRNWAKIPPGKTNALVDPKRMGFSCKKYHPNRPANTISKNDGNLRLYGAIHWAERRRFTVAEFKRFSSFPDSFHFTGGYKAVELIGNCVPPNLIRAVASHIKKTALAQTTQQKAGATRAKRCPSPQNQTRRKTPAGKVRRQERASAPA